jgi:NAD(P)-dependent dehydrogenase (short-subunit alcohol dehydrogenase family)
LGYELARQLSESAIIIGTARNPSDAQKLQALKNVRVVGMDVASEDSIKAAAEDIKKLAPDGIDELWNNAARNGVKGPVTDEIDSKEWLAEFQTNVIGQSIVTRLLLPLLRKSQNAKVVFMSSGCGSVTERTGDDTLVVYSCTKAALDMTVKVSHPSSREAHSLLKVLC